MRTVKKIKLKSFFFNINSSLSYCFGDSYTHLLATSAQESITIYHLTIFKKLFLTKNDE